MNLRKMISVSILAVASAGFINQGFVFADQEWTDSVEFEKLPTQKELMEFLKIDPAKVNEGEKIAFVLRGCEIPGKMNVSDIVEMLSLPFIVKLDWSHSNIGDKGAEIIRDALIRSTSLRELDLRANEIGAAGATELAEALEKNENTNLTVLDFRSNVIRDAGARKIGEALQTNTTLTTLNLNSNHIKTAGARAISFALKVNTALRKLLLSPNAIGSDSAGATKFVWKTAGPIKTITTLTLDLSEIGDDGAVAIKRALRTNTTLRTLLANHNDIEVIGKGLEKLFLGNNFVRKGSGARAIGEALKTNTALMELYLGGDINTHRDITGDGAIAIVEGLKVNTTLTVLDLTFRHLLGPNSLIDLVVALQTNISTNITVLKLGYAWIDDYKARAIGNLLKTNTSLEILDLHKSIIVGDGIVNIIIKGLAKNSSLYKLDLSGCVRKEEEERMLFEVLKTNTTLTEVEGFRKDLIFEEEETPSGVFEAEKRNVESYSSEKEVMQNLSDLLQRNTTLAALPPLTAENESMQLVRGVKRPHPEDAHSEELVSKQK